MAGMRDLANHIIETSNSEGLSVTNLQLQKIMFFIFGRLVSDKGINDPLVIDTYNLNFRRWSYGPVVEEIYFDYNQFGGRPIIEEGVENATYSHYNDDIVHLLNVDPFKLVEVTHKLPSWADYRDDIEARRYVPPYNLDDFGREFRRNE